MGHGDIIRERRKALGISEAEAAGRLGINGYGYSDLEAFDEELTMTLTLAQVSRLCRLLRLEPFHLLGEPPPVRPIHPEELRERVLADCRRRDWTVGAFSTRVGWDVQGLIETPDAFIADLTLDALQDICAHLGVSRIEAIPPPAGR